MTTEEIIKLIGRKKLKAILLEFFVYYYSPLKFYKIFFRKSNLDKIIQCSVYGIILLIIEYLLIDDTTYKLLGKALIIEISLSIKIIVILIFSDFILAYVTDNKYNTVNMLFVVILQNILIAPFQLVFFGLYLHFENYNYLFFSNFIVLINFLYLFFFSSFIFHNKIGKIILNIFLNLIFINLLILLNSKISIDKYNEDENFYLTDHILKERYDKAKYFKHFSEIPTHQVVYRVGYKKLYRHFIFASPIDTISKGNFEYSMSYHKDVTNDIKVLDTMIDNLYFKRNQLYFNKYKEMLVSLDKLMIDTQFSKLDIVRADSYMTKDSIITHKLYYFKVPDKIYKMNEELILNNAETFNISEISFLPFKIQSYFLPVVNLINDNKSK